MSAHLDCVADYFLASSAARLALSVLPAALTFPSSSARACFFFLPGALTALSSTARPAFCEVPAAFTEPSSIARPGLAVPPAFTEPSSTALPGLAAAPFLLFFWPALPTYTTRFPDRMQVRGPGRRLRPAGAKSLLPQANRYRYRSTDGPAALYSVAYQRQTLQTC